MREIRISLTKKKRKKGKEINLKSTKSKEIDDFFIRTTTFFNLIGKLDNKLVKTLYCDKEKVIYLPVLYIELLRKFIIKMYEKTEDPIATGYVHKSNLEYTMEYVKVIYNNLKPRRGKLIKKAAFILYNIVSKHPFIDGNKRTAIITCNSFLEYNGCSIGNLPFRESRKFITDVAMGKKSEIDCQKFIRKHISLLVVSKKAREQISRLNREIESMLKRKIKKC